MHRLISITRPELATRCVASAAEWRVISLTDFDRIGAAATRNRLFRAAVEEGATVVGYADDDDELIPGVHDALLTALGEADILYHDYECVVGRKRQTWARRYSGRLKDDVQGLTCWNWIARTEALARIEAANGFLWSPDVTAGLSPWFWLQVLNVGLKVAHAPIVAYRYSVDGHDKLSKHPDFQANRARFAAQLQEAACHLT
jgi:hypothetical protein